MNGNCHFVFGASLGTALAMNTDRICNALPNLSGTPETAALFVLGGILGGIFPDIDNPASYMGKLTVPVSTAIGKLGELSGKTGTMHRGILHDPTIYLLGLVLAYLYCPPLCGIFLGCLSHLLLDMFNPAGVPFLLGKRLHLGKVKSGSRESVILTWVLTGAVLLAGIFLVVK